MPQSLPQRWARLIGGQGRPSARPPSADAVAERVRRYPERAAQGLADQALRQDPANARSWLAQQLEEAAELLDAATRTRIAELAEAELSRRLPNGANHDD
jgi:hypothetical protein